VFIFARCARYDSNAPLRSKSHGNEFYSASIRQVNLAVGLPAEASVTAPTARHAISASLAPAITLPSAAHLAPRYGSNCARNVSTTYPCCAGTRTIGRPAAAKMRSTSASRSLPVLRPV
jgi:hypothetical protein